MKIEANRKEDTSFIKIKGRLDTLTAPQLEEALQSEPDETREIIFDFSELEYISSAGLRVILAVYKKMKKKDGTCMIRGACDEVREVFLITGFSEFIRIEGEMHEKNF